MLAYIPEWNDVETDADELVSPSSSLTVVALCVAAPAFFISAT
jgi:hypothetical protein